MKNIANNKVTKFMAILIGLLVSTSMLAQNGNVREETARQVGLNFLRLKDENPRSDLQLTRVDAVQYPNLYVYNTSENGFIVVASDNRMEPILAYSDEGTFDKDNVAPGANFWFEMYEYAIDSIVRNNVRDVDEQIARKWDDLENGIMPEPERSGYYPDSYGPLIMTQWDQGDVDNWDNNYNKFCPYYESGGKTYKAVTGCVATALAQLLNYFHVNIPRRNISYAFRHTPYNPGSRFPRYDFFKLLGISGIHYSELMNGCNLPPKKYYSIGGWNEYSGMDRVAKMMLDCGLSVDMIYGHGSGAFTLEQHHNCNDVSSAEMALKQYFGFPEVYGLIKNTQPHWVDTLKKHICHNDPIIYDAFEWDNIEQKLVRHSFICDGYKNNKFWFNFGWGGSGDGYYTIYDVNGFHYNQSGLFVKPVKDDDWVVVYDTLQYGESKNYEWCNGLINVTPGSYSHVDEHSIVYNYPTWYRLLNRCTDNSIILLLNVLIERTDTIRDSKTICRRDDYVYHGSHNNQSFVIHFSRSETDFSGTKIFYKDAFSSLTGEFLGVCELTLTTDGIIEENHLPPVTVSRCDLPYHGDYYPWDTGDEIICCYHSGVYEKVYERNGECERVDFLHLTITEPENQVFTDTLLCYNSCPFYFHGILIDLQSDTIGRITRYNVCENDVLYTLDLHLIDTVPEVLAHTICTDEAPFTWRGHTLPWTTPGNYDTVFRVITTECMCDTIFYISLSILDCCEHPLDCLEDEINEGNRSTPSNLEAIYYGLKYYFDYRSAMNGFLVNVLQGVTWHSIEDRNSFWNLFQSLLDPNSGMMSEEAMQQLITTNPYSYVSDDYITNLVERYNRSAMYWNEGQYSVWYLPQGYNPDNFIEYDTASMNKAYEAYDYAIAHGFGDVKAMYDNAYELLAAEVDNIQSSVCAKVTVQFNQKMTMTREAFNGTLQIFNGHESIPMEDILVDFRIEDQQGNDCTNHFQINTLSLDQITGISGDGSLAAQTNGTALVQFIPTKNAAPTEPKVYSFGGSFSFIDPFTGEGLTYPLYPVDITVNPSPDLRVDYFMQRNILGDDALTTDVVEPSVPAELGVIIHNQGAGEAKNVTLETAEPQIIDNEHGLAIDFAMYGASFNGSPRQLGLMEIPFGNIGSGQTAVGEWLFTSSLLGHFISYDAHVIHNSSYGNSDLSLVSHLDIHELIHPIYAYGNLDDGINDFLVNDNPDAYDTPDSIYFSHGGKTSVGVVDDISFDHLVSPSDTIVTLTVEPSRVGWNYGVTDDPGMNQYNIVSCIRNNDNQVIPLNNVWLTFVTIPDGGDPVYENKLHIVDTIPVQQTTTYALVFEYNPDASYSMAQNMSLSQGWNWWSTYIEQSNIDGLSMLENSLGHKGVTIKSQFDFVQNFYSDYGEDVWFGSLEGLANEQGYMIDVTEDCSVSMAGVRAKPVSHPITINPNWNWIGYPVTSRQSVTSALADYNALPEDLIKSHYEFSVYYNGFGWFPDDLVMTPGEGYFYYSNAPTSQTLTYSTSRGEVLPEKSDKRVWKTNVHAFADNISIVAVVSIDSIEQRDEELELGAFVNGECRGSARLKHFGPLDRYYAVLSVAGQEGDKVEFGFINKDKGQGSMVSENHITFVRNGIMGSLGTPYVVNFNTLKDEAQEGSMVLFPNPVERGKTFSLEIPKDEMLKELVIVDMLGEEILRKTGATKPNEIAGLPVAGIYVVKAITEFGNVYHGRLIVK